MQATATIRTWDCPDCAWRIVSNNDRDFTAAVAKHQRMCGAAVILAIGEHQYEARQVRTDCGGCWELTKLIPNGQVYTVHPGRGDCSCPDSRFRHRSQFRLCKHVQALRALGKEASRANATGN